jgi:hypothetical protein
MRPDELVPFDYINYNRKTIHANKLNCSICLPSTIQSYNLATQFVKQWFLSKFNKDTFKSIYIEGKNIYDEFRSVPKIKLIKRPKPSLAIVPSIDWSFNNDNLDMHQFGLDTYQPRGLYKNAFFKDDVNNMNLGIAMQTLMINFAIRIRVETKPQQMDMYKFIQIAHRVGNIYGEDVDLDFHIPYALMIQMAEDAGFEVEYSEDNKKYPKIKNIHGFLSYLNTHSGLPFLYKFRAENGKNEFFLRMQRMYVNISPTDLSADDGEKEGQLNNNFTIDLNVEIRFPAPQFYAYYSSNEHKIKTVYGAWNQTTGVISSVYCFKGYEVPSTNSYGWNMWMSTTYEEEEDKLNEPLVIDFSGLFEGDLKDYINDCIAQGMSPAIFCDIIMVNGAEKVIGKMDWESLTFTSIHPVRNRGTFIGVYLDMEYMNNYILCTKDGNKNRLQHTKSKETSYIEPTI